MSRPSQVVSWGLERLVAVECREFQGSEGGRRGRRVAGPRARICQMEKGGSHPALSGHAHVGRQLLLVAAPSRNSRAHFLVTFFRRPRFFNFLRQNEIFCKVVAKTPGTAFVRVLHRHNSRWNLRLDSVVTTGETREWERLQKVWLQGSATVLVVCGVDRSSFVAFPPVSGSQ